MKCLRHPSRQIPSQALSQRRSLDTSLEGLGILLLVKPVLKGPSALAFQDVYAGSDSG